jgi:type IV pilus assembly protein PilY1
MLGKDVNDENGNSNHTEVRPSVHGDVVHTPPLPVN